MTKEIYLRHTTTGHWQPTTQFAEAFGPHFKSFRKALAALTRPTSNEGDVVHIYIHDDIKRIHAVDAVRRRKVR